MVSDLILRLGRPNWMNELRGWEEANKTNVSVQLQRPLYLYWALSRRLLSDWCNQEDLIQTVSQCNVESRHIFVEALDSPLFLATGQLKRRDQPELGFAVLETDLRRISAQVIID